MLCELSDCLTIWTGVDLAAHGVGKIFAWRPPGWNYISPSPRFRSVKSAAGTKLVEDLAKYRRFFRGSSGNVVPSGLRSGGGRGGRCYYVPNGQAATQSPQAFFLPWVLINKLLFSLHKR